MYYVYIIHSKKLNKRYIGRTNDLRSRIKRHNNGGSDFTNRGMPWQLIYYEAFITKKDAMEEEAFLKTGKGRERLKFLLKNSMEELESA
jgi:putative endonuclease